MIDLEGKMRGRARGGGELGGGREGAVGEGGNAAGKKMVEKGWVEGWLEEGERKVEWVGGRYGILGFEKKDVKGVLRASSSSELVQTTTPTGDLGKGVAGDVANALGAYMIVKVSRSLSSLLVSSPFVRSSEEVSRADLPSFVPKALLPLRIAASIYLSPAFARALILPVHRVWHRTNGLGVFRGRK